MKRPAISVVLLLIFLLLSGCEGSPFAPDFAPQRAFTLFMAAEINGKSYQATLTCASYESLELSFTDPPELSCFSVRTSGGGYRMNVDGSEDAVQADELYADAPLRLLFLTVKTAVFTNHGAFIQDKENGVYTAELTVDNQPAAVTFDREGYLLTLTAPGLTASFTRASGS